jgi:hypothetical protein
MDGSSERNTIHWTFPWRDLTLEVLIMTESNFVDQQIVDTVRFDYVQLASLAGSFDLRIGVA